MNPFLLTKMNNAFVPNRQNDIAETTPRKEIPTAEYEERYVLHSPIIMATTNDHIGEETHLMELPPDIQLNRNPSLDTPRPMQVTKLEDTEYFRHTRTKPRDEGSLVIVDNPDNISPSDRPNLIKAIQTAGVHISVDTEVPVTALLEQWKQSIKHLLPLPESFYADDLPIMNINLTNVVGPFTAIGNTMDMMANAHQTFILALYHEIVDNCDTIYNALMTEDTGIVFDHIARPSQNLIQLFVTKPQGA